MSAPPLRPGQQSPLDPTSTLVSEFRVELWRIAAEVLEFGQMRDLEIQPNDYPQEDARRERYFDQHQADSVLEACRRLIVGWYRAEASRLGLQGDQVELIRAIERRFPIWLRQFTPSPLRHLIEREAFEKRTLTLVKETLLLSTAPGEEKWPVQPTGVEMESTSQTPRNAAIQTSSKKRGRPRSQETEWSKRIDQRQAEIGQLIPDFNRKELASLLGLSARSLYDLEKLDPSVERRRNVVKHLNRPVSELVEELKASREARSKRGT